MPLSAEEERYLAHQVLRMEDFKLGALLTPLGRRSLAVRRDWHRRRWITAAGALTEAGRRALRKIVDAGAEAT